MGPACAGYEKIIELIDAGMSVARLNFSHGNHEQHQKTIENVKRARKEKGIPLAIMLDTKGPEIRVGKMKGDGVSLEAKQELLLVKETVEGDEKRIQVTPGSVLDNVKEGTKILFDDGYIISQVIRRTKEGVVVQIENSGILKTFKGVNMPHAAIVLPAMTQQDVDDITFGCKHDVDFIAASFIRSADHLREIKKLLAEQGKPETLVIAKIENSQGVDNFDSILAAADGIMVARGDLGVELPLKQVPRLQKMMIRKCRHAAKPVVTATQMLESMIKNPRPTRAEVSDVANAIYDSTSCVMLSGETASGQYPIEAVKMMQSIIEETEKDFNYVDFFESDSKESIDNLAYSVALAAVKTAYTAGAKAIFVLTSSGYTARLISRFRPQMPIFAFPASQKVYNQLAFSWGVIPIPPEKASNMSDAFSLISRYALDRGFVRPGDIVIVTAGSTFGVSGGTNMMIIDRIPSS
jgi:pyruvate kinase